MHFQLAMIVTLSPARSCGWETWFSCTYGEDLQKLRCPVQPVVPKDLPRLLMAAQAAVTKSEAELNQLPPAVGTDQKYHSKRLVQQRHNTRVLEQLVRLAEVGKSDENGVWGSWGTWGARAEQPASAPSSTSLVSVESEATSTSSPTGECALS